MRNPSALSSMYFSSLTAAPWNFGIVSLPSSNVVAMVEQPLDLTVYDDRVEAFLAAEVLVDDGFGHACLGGDLLDRGSLETAFGEQPPPDVEQLLAPFFTGHPSAAGSEGGIVVHHVIIAFRPPVRH